MRKPRAWLETSMRQTRRLVAALVCAQRAPLQFRPGATYNELEWAQSTNLNGLPIYSKGKLVSHAGQDTYYFLISSKKAF